MVRVSSRSAAWSLVLLSLVQTGCGSGTPDGRAEVSGRVMVDGAAPKEGAITFSPVDRLSPTTGGMIVDGAYTVHAPIGEAKVAIRVPKVVGQQRLYDSPEAPLQSVKTESLPGKFNDDTELTFDVKAGKNTCDFDLSTH